MSTTPTPPTPEIPDLVTAEYLEAVEHHSAAHNINARYRERVAEITHEHILKRSNLRAKLRAEITKLREDIGILNGRLIERTEAMLERQREMLDEARRCRSVATDALSLLEAIAASLQESSDDRNISFQERDKCANLAHLIRQRTRPMRAHLDPAPTSANCGQSTSSADNLRTEPNRSASRARIAQVNPADRFRAMFGEQVKPNAAADIAAMREAIKEAYGALKTAQRQWRGYADQREDEDLETAKHLEGELYRIGQTALAKLQPFITTGA